jgi:uncharacterized membrane-anchored protein
MRVTIFLVIVTLFSGAIRANTGDSLHTGQQTLQYQYGVVPIANDVAQLTIPTGFKFLNAEQSKHIISEVWHQSPQPDLAGMLFPQSADPLNKDLYAVIINYEPRGFVRDIDAGRIDYDKVLQNLQRDEADDNAERKTMGYPAVHLVSWVQKPVYDKTFNELYWAKEIQVGNNNAHMLSYNIRVLGRNGIITMSAEGSTNDLALLNGDISKVLHMALFTNGNRYADFDVHTDKVAAWTIGTLVTGKIVNNTRVFALLGKYLNLILSWMAVLIVLISNLLKPGILPTCSTCDISLAGNK